MQVVPSYHAWFVMQEDKKSRALACLLESKKEKATFHTTRTVGWGRCLKGICAHGKNHARGCWRFSISTLYLWVGSTKAANISQVVDTSRFPQKIYEWIRSKQVTSSWFPLGLGSNKRTSHPVRYPTVPKGILYEMEFIEWGRHKATDCYNTTRNFKGVAVKFPDDYACWSKNVRHPNKSNPKVCGPR